MSLKIHGGNDVGTNRNSQRRTLDITTERRATLYAIINRVQEEMRLKSLQQKSADNNEKPKIKLDISEIRDYISKYGI